jgi:Ca2+-transporting ATPase
MITGDQHATAAAIARSLGLLSPDDGALDRRDLAAVTGGEIGDRLGRVGVFSRVAPEDKLTIVQALKARGDVVAMIGDGVNDAPALRAADVGVAMGGRGTDVAREAADIVLRDDRFETIAAAVEEGRVIADNIRKFVFYLFSCNLAEIIVLLTAAAAGLPPPLLPMQILWLNLVTDTFPALALAVEPAEPGVMERPPRDPQAALFSRAFLVEVAAFGALIAAASLGAYAWALAVDAARATTVAFMTLAFAQALHLGNARSGRAVLALGAALRNPLAVGAVALVVLLQLAALHGPWLAAALRLLPLSRADWLVVIGAAAMPAVLGQAWRVAQARRQPALVERRSA